MTQTFDITIEHHEDEGWTAHVMDSGECIVLTSVGIHDLMSKIALRISRFVLDDVDWHEYAAAWFDQPGAQSYSESVEYDEPVEYDAGAMGA